MMGKFDGVLLVSDYDSTLYDHQFHVSQANRDALQYFINEGGFFTVATGRAYETFTPQIELEKLTLNAPVILSNGSIMYDYVADKYLHQTYLPEQSFSHMQQIMEEFPELGFEGYHEGKIYVYNPNPIIKRHFEIVQVPYTVCETMSNIPTPWTKLILEQEHELLKKVKETFLSRWGHLYEVIFSGFYLLELTAKGVTKGAMVLKLAEMLGVERQDIYCVGDNQNDVPMLQISSIPFAPANCVPEVKTLNPHIVRHCNESAVAHVVEILDKRY